MNPCQSTVPLQNSQNNFQTYGQTNSNQQQSTQCTGCPGNPQGQCTQSPFGQFYRQQEGCCLQPRYPCCTAQLSTNPSNFCQGPCRNSLATGTSQQLPPPPPPPPPQLSYNLPSSPTQATNCGTLPQNIIDQIRSCLANSAPIFVLPGGCQQQPTVATQQATSMPITPGTSTTLGYQPLPVPTYVSTPSFYPYPIPFPLPEPFDARFSKERVKNCGCSSRSDPIESLGTTRQCAAYSCLRNLLQDEEEHRCTESTDDAICSKRNCPSAISLQALASQLLSIQGIVSCAATRLILRKIPGSNIVTSMEDTMERAQRSLCALNKDQLLNESRNGQQVNALINLHMTANPPANVVPILTLVQLKVNVLKAQVENLINAKLMENQGFEVEATGSIDPAVLLLKTDDELREFLAVLKEKECQESVNANFAPYCSQRAIAENRLGNLRRKIRQVEEEFARRRYVGVSPPPPMSARIVGEFTNTPCRYSSLDCPGIPCSLISDKTEDRGKSPDPFAIALKCPRKLRLKAHVGSPKASYDYSNRSRTTARASTRTEKASQSEPSKTEERNDRCSSLENCECYEEESSSEESPDEDKKKLRLKVDPKGHVTVTSIDNLRNVPLLKLASNVSLRAIKSSDVVEKRKRANKFLPTYEISEKKNMAELPSSRSTAVPPLEEISEEGPGIDGSYSGSHDPVPSAKSFELPANERESESFKKVPSSLRKDSEVKAERPTSELETIETKVPDADFGELDGWKLVDDDGDDDGDAPQSNFEELKSSNVIDTSIAVPTVLESRSHHVASIKVESSGREEEASGYNSRYRLDVPSNDPFEENSIDDRATTRETEKPAKIFTTFLQIDNNIVKSEGTEKEEEKEVKAQLDVADHRKRFVTTANIMITLPPNEDKEIEPESNEEEEKVNWKDNLTTRTIESEEVGTGAIATLAIEKKREREDKKKVDESRINHDRIVSILTDVEYDNPESICERFRSALTRKCSSNNGGDRCCRQEEKENEKRKREEEVEEEVEEEAKVEKESVGEGKRVNSGGNRTMISTFPGNRFPWRIVDNENHVDRSDFCERIALKSTVRNPQESLKPNACIFGTATKGISLVRSENDTSKCFLETSFGILSNVFSLVGDRIASFGSVVDKITVFGNTWSNLRNPSENVTESCKTDRCRYLPVSSQSRRSIKTLDKKERSVIERDWLRLLRGKLKDSIIKEWDNGKSYVATLDDSFIELEQLSFSKLNLARPYELRRNLLIRSHLKDRKHARKQNLPPPFTILKRRRSEMNGKKRQSLA